MDLGNVMVSFGVEAAAALFLAAALVGLRRWYHSPVLTWWAAGWLAASAASLAAATALLSVVGLTAVPRSVATGLFILATLGQAICQVEGARRLSGSALGPAGLAGAVGAAFLYAAAAVTLTDDGSAGGARTVFRLAVPYLVLGAGFAVSAVLVARTAEGRALGARLLPAALFVYAMQVTFTGLVSGRLLDVPTTAVLFTHLFALLPVAFTIPLWFLEEERAALQAAQRREHDVQERLIQAQRLEALGHLAAGVAHDFNNLLTVVGAHAELIEMDVGAGHLRDSAREITEAKRRGAGLITHLLTFARRQPLVPRKIDVRAEVDRLESLVRPLIGDGIRLTIEHRAPTVPVLIGGELVERVLMNLVLNARDAVADRGTVVVATDVVHLNSPLVAVGETVPPGRWCTLEVVDDGVGIPADIRPRIFDPFFTTKARNRGTGLGLATVYGVIRDAGGYVAVESKVGRGASFRVFLPYRD